MPRLATEFSMNGTNFGKLSHAAIEMGGCTRGLWILASTTTFSIGLYNSDELWTIVIISWSSCDVWPIILVFELSYCLYVFITFSWSFFVTNSSCVIFGILLALYEDLFFFLKLAWILWCEVSFWYTSSSKYE